MAGWTGSECRVATLVVLWFESFAAGCGSSSTVLGRSGRKMVLEEYCCSRRYRKPDRGLMQDRKMQMENSTAASTEAAMINPSCTWDVNHDVAAWGGSCG